MGYLQQFSNSCLSACEEGISDREKLELAPPTSAVLWLVNVKWKKTQIEIYTQTHIQIIT